MRSTGLLFLIIAVAVFILAGVDSQAAQGAPEEQAVPLELREGEGLFKLNCLRCHGARGAGTDQGPPLVHKVYEPGHHSDMTFYLAVLRGVRAHHWRFGDMPKIEGLKEKEVGSIILYVRWLQRLAGIE